MATYQVLTPVTGLTVGQTITGEDLAKNHPGLNVPKLLKNGAIREGNIPAVPKPGGVERIGAPTDAQARATGGHTGTQNVKTAGKPMTL